MASLGRSRVISNMVFQWRSARNHMCVEAPLRYRNLQSWSSHSESWKYSRSSDHDGGSSYRGYAWLLVPFGRTSREFGLHCSRLKGKEAMWVISKGEHERIEVQPTSSNLLLVGYLSVEVATVSVVHHDTQAPFVHEWFFVGNDIWMPHGFQNMNLAAMIRKEQ